MIFLFFPNADCSFDCCSLIFGVSSILFLEESNNSLATLIPTLSESSTEWIQCAPSLLYTYYFKQQKPIRYLARDWHILLCMCSCCLMTKFILWSSRTILTNFYKIWYFGLPEKVEWIPEYFPCSNPLEAD